MEKHFYKTFVKKEGDGYYASTYAVGQISGIMHVLCNGAESKRGGMRMRELGWYLGIECTAEQYSAFAEYIEGMYPGLCKFDAKL